MSVGNLEYAMNNATEATTANTATATEAAAPAKAEAKINWGSVASNTAVVGGVAVGGIIATGIVYGLVAKVAKVTYDILS